MTDETKAKRDELIKWYTLEKGTGRYTFAEFYDLGFAVAEAESLKQKEQLKILRENLEKIADLTSAFEHNRIVSYADWELRLIAKNTLAKVDAIEKGES